ncbi:hypothetical protein ABPG75_000124 [Micractinium tetrahymenae]
MSLPLEQFLGRIAADTRPTPELFLPNPSLIDMSDCFATVHGTPLPLHSQILSAQSGVLHGLFASLGEGLPAGEASPGISAAFEGGTPGEVLCLLRLLYNPGEAHPYTFTAMSSAGVLPGIARLAHLLDAASLLRSLESFVQGLALRAGQTSMPHLLNASLDSSILAQILVKTVQRMPGGVYDPPAILDVVCNPYGTALGFSTSLSISPGIGGFRAVSPYVEISGFNWELTVRTEGSDLTVALSIGTEDTLKTQGVKAVTILCTATVIDQKASSSGARICGVRQEKAGTLSTTCPSLAWPEFMPLEQLRSSEHGFLQQGRLLVRADVRITEVEAA